MSWRLVKQPNGLFARFSDVVDDFTNVNLSTEDALTLCRDQYNLSSVDAIVKINAAVDDLSESSNKGAGLDRFYGCLETIREEHGTSRFADVCKNMCADVELFIADFYVPQMLQSAAVASEAHIHINISLADSTKIKFITDDKETLYEENLDAGLGRILYDVLAGKVESFNSLPEKLPTEIEGLEIVKQETDDKVSLAINLVFKPKPNVPSLEDLGYTKPQVESISETMSTNRKHSFH